MANTAAAIGIHGFWGLSASFDCIEAFESLSIPSTSTPAPPAGAAAGSEGLETLRVLLIHPGDIRHIITTTTRRLRKKTASGCPLPQIHFYIIEDPLEVLARDILTWEVFLDFEIPIRQRANLFLEIFGNAKVQDRTSRYLEQMGEKLRDLIVRNSSTLNTVDISYLKHRERDELENIFKSYSRKTLFDTEALRNQRMRGYYAERYDSRRALYDWDWQYGLHDTASIIHVKLFRDWRESGIAFE